MDATRNERAINVSRRHIIGQTQRPRHTESRTTTQGLSPTVCVYIVQEALVCWYVLQTRVIVISDLHSVADPRGEPRGHAPPQSS